MSNTLALNLSAGSLDAYVSSAFRIPVLSAEEEHTYALRLRDLGDLEAARRLVLSHLRFVIRVARGYTGYGLPQQDLIQEGTIGLMKAVRRFDPDKNVRLVSFAVHWIRAEIHEYILRNWRIVKVATTKAQRKLFFNLRGAKKRLGWLNREEINQVADDLGVKPETVVEMEQRLSAHDLPWDPPDSTDDELGSSSPANWLPSPQAAPELQLEKANLVESRAAMLHTALAKLDKRSREILAARWLGDNKITLQELAERYSVSAERIRQIEANALKKLRKLVKAA